MGSAPKKVGTKWSAAEKYDVSKHFFLGLDSNQNIFRAKYVKHYTTVIHTTYSLIQADNISSSYI